MFINIAIYLLLCGKSFQRAAPFYYKHGPRPGRDAGMASGARSMLNGRITGLANKRAALRSLHDNMHFSSNRLMNENEENEHEGSCECGKANNDNLSSLLEIDGGIETFPHKFPWMVQFKIVYNFDHPHTGSRNQVACTGSLLDSRH